MGHQRWSPTGVPKDNLSRYRYSGNGISGILKTSQHITISHFFNGGY